MRDRNSEMAQVQNFALVAWRVQERVTSWSPHGDGKIETGAC